MDKSMMRSSFRLSLFMSGKTRVEQNTETAVELLVAMRDNDTKNFDRLTAAIEDLTPNIAQLTTQQKQTAANLDKVAERLDRMITAIDGHLAVAQAQSANIAELAKLATALASR
jgi:phage-related minor tail protein